MSGMKSLVICAAALMVSSAFATTVSLSDGRSFADAQIISETPTTVVIKHADGLSSVSKKLLPPALQEKHPIDEAAAVANEKKSAAAREASLKARNEERERSAKLLAQRYADVAERQALEKKAIADKNAETARAQASAQRSLESYFRDKFSWNPGSQRTVDVTIREIRPADGWPNRWVVSGSVLIRNHVPSPTRINTEGMSAKEIRRAEYRAGKTSIDFREFTADYSTEGGSPSLNVSLR
jgi:hypothetical protein